MAGADLQFALVITLVAVPSGFELFPQRRAEADLLEQVRPAHDEALRSALDEAQELPELAPLVESLHELPAAVRV